MRGETSIVELCLDRKPGLAVYGHEEVNLALVNVPQKLDSCLVSLVIGYEMHEFQQMGSHQVLETGGLILHLRPVP